MDLSFRHDLWWARLPRSPLDHGRVAGLVRRPPGGRAGEREKLDELELSVEQGVLGDRWQGDPDATPGMQVSLINIGVLSSLAPREQDRPQSGDNLWVDLDLSENNLPVGSRLAMGSCILEVSEVPHRPCTAFHVRFGKTAAQRVARANRRGLRGRGVLCRVVQGGRVSSGDSISVTRPGDRRR